MKTMRISSGLIIIVATFAAFMPALAQSNQPVQVEKPVTVQPADGDERLNTARTLMRQTQWQAASALLEELYQQDPDNNLVQNLLKQCYDQLKYYGKSEILTRRLIEKNSQNYYLFIDLAELLVKQGQSDSALTVYRYAFKILSDMNPELANSVILSLMDNGLDQPALKMIDSLRLARNNPTLFAIERAQSFERQRLYADAVKEYLPLLDVDTSGKSIEAERRLLALLDFPESAAPVEKALLAQVSSISGRKVLGLLSAQYIKSGRYDEAFTFAVRQDSVEQSKGLALLQYMRQCQDRHAWPQVVKMGKYLTTAYPNAPFATEAAFRYGDALAESGSWDDAIDAYHEVIAKSPIDADKSEALYKIAAIFADRMHNCEVALVYYDSVLAVPTRTMSFIQAQMGKPYCYLQLGRLDEAETGFSALIGSTGSDESEEEIAYNLAMLKLYTGQYDSADVALRRLMVNYPRGFYVNDALQLVALLGDAKGQTDLIGDFAAALLYMERQMPDSARAQLQRLVDNPSPTLADIALYRLAGLQLTTGDSTSALGYLDKLTSEHADSYFAPWGMKIKADILIRRPATFEQGKTLYRTLLESFPNYPFISDVRKRLRQLEEGSRIG